MKLITDFCTLTIRPNELNYVKQRGWLKPKKILHQVIAINESMPQEYLIQQIADELKKSEWRCRTRVVLAGDYVKFRLVKHDTRLDQAESMALLKHQFTQVYDKQIQGWLIFVAKPIFEKNNIACAVNQSLLTQLQLVFKSAQIKLASLEPCFVAWLNIIRKEAPQDGWLAIVDIKTVYALKLYLGEIIHLRELQLASNFVSDDNNEIERLMAREMLALGDDMSDTRISYYWVGLDSELSTLQHIKQYEILNRHITQGVREALV